MQRYLEDAQLLWALGMTGNPRERVIRQLDIDLRARESQRQEIDQARKMALAREYSEQES